MESQVPSPTSTRNQKPRGADLAHFKRGPIRKFMQTIGHEMFLELERISDEKGIHVQTLLRAVIIPEWMQEHGLSKQEIQNSLAHFSDGRYRKSSRGLAAH